MSDQERFEYEVMSQLEQSTELGELFAALSKAQGQMTGAVKDSQNPFFKSKYADLHQVWEAVRKPLSDNNLSVIQSTNQRGTTLFVVTTIGHSSGQWMKSFTPVKMMKDDPQAMGSAITYARRYALAAIAGVAQMDDDGESAMKRDEVKQTVTIPAKQQAEFIKQVTDCLETVPVDDLHLRELWAEWGADEKAVLWSKFNSQQRNTMKELLK